MEKSTILLRHSTMTVPSELLPDVDRQSFMTVQSSSLAHSSSMNSCSSLPARMYAEPDSYVCSTSTTHSDIRIHNTSQSITQELQDTPAPTQDMSETYHPNCHSPLLTSESSLPNAVFNGHSDKSPLPKLTKLKTFFSAFHSRKCRPLSGSEAPNSKHGCNDLESCSSSYQANYPWRHKGRRRIQRLSYVLLVYVAGVLALMAVRVGNSQPWYQQDGHVADVTGIHGDSEGFMPHQVGSRHKRNVRIEYITLAKNRSDDHKSEY